MATVFVLNGPNLNLLGVREPQIYGSASLAEIENGLRAFCAAQGVELEFRQSNHEGDLVDWIHEASQRDASVVLNAGAYTHTSIALHDAIRAAVVDVVEVHLSNVHAREPFRRHSAIAAAARGVILGFGPLSYELAVTALLKLRDRRPQTDT